MLAHCLIDDICLPVFENIYIFNYCITVFFFLFFFLNSFLNFFIWRTTLETSVLLCALMCLSSVNIIYIYIYIYIYAYFVICLCTESKFVLFACIIMFYQIDSLTMM